ncbi:MAG: hypothetical protein JKY54_12545 [Flavobacteriales bacterium]|nr:hypothetical protein [Flavobacteriales bacterium]
MGFIVGTKVSIQNNRSEFGLELSYRHDLTPSAEVGDFRMYHNSLNLGVSYLFNLIKASPEE